MTDITKKPVPFKESDIYKVLEILNKHTMLRQDDPIWDQFENVREIIGYLKVCGTASTCNLVRGENGSGDGYCITRYGKIVYAMLNNPNIVNVTSNLCR